MYFIRRVLERGQGLVEYALILALVAIVVIVVVAAVGQGIQEVFCDIVLQLGGDAPDIGACAAPRVTLVGISNGQTVTGAISVEAVIKDNKGNKNPNIKQVTFYIDGTKINDEFAYKFCLVSGDGPCSSYTPSVGTHTLRAVATDADNNTGEASVTFTRN
jgi:pilus assembly protein Flp/PilA